ncbi:hypothetical protein GIW45_17500 [Pseudomonas congelans]|uniref:hypothetical protein n=1 Tax=Pseudomonas congelans TaxID=200452 RepID=UPI001F2A7816|nr:hypothetical protein [Pseudomonas congelans]MCF5165819.1 hypothetical protein [Pseudomonas congelans]
MSKQQALLETLKCNKQFVYTLEFEKQLKALMKRHGVRQEDILNYLSPAPEHAAVAVQEKRRLTAALKKTAYSR